MKKYNIPGAHYFEDEKYPWTFFNKALIQEGLCQIIETEFERLSQMPQLGISGEKQTHKGLTYLFMNLVCEASGGRGAALSSDVRRLNTEKSSIILTKAELIKLWFFFSQYGHLMDAHASERFVLETLRSKPELLQEFLVDFPPPSAQYAQHIIASGSYFVFHYVLALWRIIHRFPGSEFLKNFSIQVLQEYFLVSEYVRKEEEKYFQDKGIDGGDVAVKFSTTLSCFSGYRVFEKLAYLNNVFPNDDNPNKRNAFIIDPYVLIKQIRDEQGLLDSLNNGLDPRGALLSQLYAYLVETVYMNSQNALRHWSLFYVLADQIQFTKETLSQNLLFLFNNSLVEQAIQRESKVEHVYSLPHPFYVYKRNDERQTTKTSKVLRNLPNASSMKNGLPHYNLSLRAILGLYVYGLWWPEVSTCVEICYIKEISRPASARRVYNGIEAISTSWKALNGTFYGGIRDAFVKSPVHMTKMIQSFISYLFKVSLQSFSVDVRSQLSEQLQIQALPWTLCYGLNEVLLSMSDYLTVHNRISLDKGHRAEPVACIKAFLQDTNYSTSSETFYVFAWGGVTIRGNNKEKQIDGMWIAIERTSFRLYLIESKTTKAKADKCVEILKTKLVEVGVSHETLSVAEGMMIGALAGGMCFKFPAKKLNENTKKNLTPKDSKKEIDLNDDQ